MPHEPIASECFSQYNRTYYFDYREAVNRTHYIVLTCEQRNKDGSVERSSIRIFEENFAFTISALSSLFHHAQYHPRLATSNPVKGEVNGIKSWEPELRPREKMLEQGRAVMSDAELLAMLIGSGTPGVTAVDLAAQILWSVDNDLKRLAGLSTEELTQFQGIGLAKAMSIHSAMELAVRMAGSVSARHLKAVLG